VYVGLTFRSVDGGVTFSRLPQSPLMNALAVTIAPNGTIYASLYDAGIFVSTDQAVTWTQIGSPVPNWPAGPNGPSVGSIVPDGGTLFALTGPIGSAGFVSKLSADGSKLEYSTYLRGHQALVPFYDFAAEPGAMSSQNTISGIALDGAGNVMLAGNTRATDFPVRDAAQSAVAGLSDAFAAVLSADGSRLTYATYWGGSSDDGGLAAAVDPQGNFILAGQTWSADFPATSGLEAPFGFGDAFVLKLASGPPVISSVVNGASYQPGIQAGGWVTIRGANLAATAATAAGGAGAMLPMSLGGVSVTIDGKTAFISYVSPSQINVIAPADSATGAVSVVVTNSNGASASVNAQLLSAAPAFFSNSGTAFALASRVSDGAVIGDPAVISGAVAAHPGDTIALWGSGFGATNPAIAPGTLTSGSPAVVTLPSVSVGGVAAQVSSAVLANGQAGVYQITIQVPLNLPAGANGISASVNGTQTPSGVMLFVANP
jgi:uncharacterized protein (TIGR03437 family)